MKDKDVTLNGRHEEHDLKVRFSCHHMGFSCACVADAKARRNCVEQGALRSKKFGKKPHAVWLWLYKTVRAVLTNTPGHRLDSLAICGSCLALHYSHANRIPTTAITASVKMPSVLICTKPLPAPAISDAVVSMLLGVTVNTLPESASH